MPPLGKRAAGTPLSEAEHQQRVDAARSRWSGHAAMGAAIAAGGVAGGITGAKLVARAVERVKNRAADHLDALAEPANRATARRARVAARHQAAMEAVERKLRSQKDFLPAAIRSMRSMSRQGWTDVRRHMDRNAEPYQIDPGSEPVWASLDAPGERRLREEVAALDAQVKDLVENGKKPSRKKVPGHIKQARVEQFERTRKRTEIIWPDVSDLLNESDVVDPAHSIQQTAKPAPSKPPITLENIPEDPFPKSHQREMKELVSTPIPTDILSYLQHHASVRKQKKGDKRISTAKFDVKLQAERRAKIDRLIQQYRTEDPSLTAGYLGSRNESLPEMFQAYDIRNVNDLESAMHTMPRAFYHDMLDELQLPRPRKQTFHQTSTITNTTRFVPEHTARIDGYPTQENRKLLASQIHRNMRDRQLEWYRRVMSTLDAKVNIYRNLARLRSRDAARDLKWAHGLGTKPLLGVPLKAGHARLGGIAAGALAGAGISYGAARALQWVQDKFRARSPENSPGALTKAAPKIPDTAQQIYDAGTEVEDDLAARLAGTLKGLANLPAKQLADGGAALRDLIARRLDTATKPLDTAGMGGAGAETPVSVLTRSGEPKLISYSLQVRSPKVTDFLAERRLKLAGDMADEQLQTIQTVLADAARMGQAPAATARILRQTIGLTPNQASQVINYRRQLETLDPRAQQRALHDKRFDKTINRAIETGTQLTDDQINRMVDNYQARYIALRATTIARTEGVGAANNGHVEAVRGFLDQNPEFTVIKTWIATDDSRTRQDHRELDRKAVVGLDTPFRAGSGDLILWPHDPDAPARQVVNCRCTLSTQIVPRASAALYGTDAAGFPTSELNLDTENA